MTKPSRTTAEIPLIMGRPEITETMSQAIDKKYSIIWDIACGNCFGKASTQSCKVCQGRGYTSVNVPICSVMCSEIYETMAQMAIQEQALRELTKGNNK